MKRILSWITLFLGLNVFYYAMSLTGRLLLWVIDTAADAGIAAVILLYFVFGSFIFAVVTGGPWFVSFAVVALSQKVYKSRRALRYWVLSVVYILYYALFIIGLLTGFIISGVPFVGYAKAACMIYFCIAMLCTGVSAVKEDGLPPTRRERLQAKLDKEIDREVQAVNKAIRREEKKRETEKVRAAAHEVDLRQKEVDKYWTHLIYGNGDYAQWFCRYMEYGGYDCNIYSDCMTLTIEEFSFIVRGAFSPSNDEALKEIKSLSEYVQKITEPSREGDTGFHGWYVMCRQADADLKSAAKLHDVTITDNIPVTRFPSVKCVREGGELLYYIPTHPQYDGAHPNSTIDSCYVSTVEEAEVKGYKCAP